MENNHGPSQQARLPVWRAWSVHVYTSLGLVFALLAAVAVLQEQAFLAVIYSSFAMFIDGTDGVLARRWQVRKWTPAFDGRKLDDIVDYLTYTFVPVLFAYRFEVVTGVWTGVLAIVLISAAYAFCNEHAKTEDGFFTGFPSYWNVIVLYLYWFDWPVWIAGSILLLFAVLVFVPLKYISLNQTQIGRKLNLLLFVGWAGVLLALLINFESPNRVLLWLSLFFPAYYMVAPFVMRF